MFCTKCGEQLGDGVKFCYKCGAAVANDDVPVQENAPLQELAQSQQAYSQPQQAYSQPQQGFSQPQQGFSQPQQGFSQPQQAYSQPQQPYLQPQQPYSQPQQPYGQPVNGAAVPQKGKSGLTIVLVIMIVVLLGVAGVIAGRTIYNKASNDEDEEIEISVSQLKNANGMAKTAYNVTAEYCADQQIMGYSLETTLADIEGIYDISRDDYGEFGSMLVSCMRDEGYENGYVYVMKADIGGWTNSFAVQWSKGRNGVEDGRAVGQYPEPISKNDREKVKFGEYYSAAPDTYDDDDDFDEDELFDF